MTGWTPRMTIKMRVPMRRKTKTLVQTQRIYPKITTFRSTTLRIHFIVATRIVWSTYKSPNLLFSDRSRHQIVNQRVNTMTRTRRETWRMRVVLCKERCNPHNSWPGSRLMLMGKIHWTLLTLIESYWTPIQIVIQGTWIHTLQMLTTIRTSFLQLWKLWMVRLAHIPSSLVKASKVQKATGSRFRVKRN